jgi:hypothetical protein
MQTVQELGTSRSLSFSNDGQKFLCIAGTSQARLCDRDGEKQYVTSLHATDSLLADMDAQGHVHQG